MDKEVLSSVVLAAAIGALVSAVITEVGRWRERAARERELLFASAIDLAKTLIGRVAAVSSPKDFLSEFMVLEKTHDMLKEIYKQGKMSEGSKNFMKAVLKQGGM
jgi:hypothetical protein